MHRAVRVFWWFAFLAVLVILVGSLPGYLAELNQSALEPEYSAAQTVALWLGALFSIASAGLCMALAALLFFKKSDDRMALFLSFYLLMFGILLAGPLEHFLPYWIPASGDVALQLQGIIWGLPTILLFLIFPTGHFTPRWTRWLVVAGGVVLVLLTLMIRDPVELVRANSLASQLSYLVLGALFLIALGIQLYRYLKVYTPLERQQTKWVLFGFIASYILLGLVSVPYFYYQNLPPDSPEPWWLPFTALGWWLGLMLQPIVFTLAIFRARLWDIDILVRRTILYSLVTVTLAFLYFGSVVVLQYIFSEFAGTEQNDLVTVLSTLVIAASFIPLRNRIQNLIDRRFNRKKYDAQQVLQKFGETVRDETDLEHLTDELLTVVQETMQPRSMSLWLKHERGEAQDAQ